MQNAWIYKRQTQNLHKRRWAMFYFCLSKSSCVSSCFPVLFSMHSTEKGGHLLGKTENKIWLIRVCFDALSSTGAHIRLMPQCATESCKCAVTRILFSHRSQSAAIKYKSSVKTCFCSGKSIQGVRLLQRILSFFPAQLWLHVTKTHDYSITLLIRFTEAFLT